LTALVVLPDGRIGMAGVTAPAVALHLGGALRLGAFPRASMPDAAISGAGTIIYVPDAAGGAVIAFSDGVVWRRVTDRMIVA
jgi:hypothetical protein